MKKLIALLLTACMTISMTACGGSNAGSSQSALSQADLGEATEYLCLECLASDLSSTPERLRELIHYFRTKQKCCLFV